METFIKTKFNIGDTVYIADHYYDFYANSAPCLITDVLIDINSRRTRISYEVEQADFTYRIPEEWAFASYEDCAQWCDARNKGE
jgi:hypothetical protein